MLESTMAIPSALETDRSLKGRHSMNAIEHIATNLTHSCIARPGCAAAADVTSNAPQSTPKTRNVFLSGLIVCVSYHRANRAKQTASNVGRQIAAASVGSEA